jgi:hypothetical protein
MMNVGAALRRPTDRLEVTLFVLGLSGVAALFLPFAYGYASLVIPKPSHAMES